VLTLCRALYTLHNGELCSKPKAAAWVQKTYPHWQPIIERSLLWRSQHEIDDLTESMAFLHEALALAQAAGYKDMIGSIFTGRSTQFEEDDEEFSG